MRMRDHSPEARGFGDEDLWRAAVERDSRYDGIFVFVVISTGVYCRPSCPARRPKRENVIFFDLSETAERAGFRPCKRCRPQEPAAPDPGVELARRACDLIEADLEGSLTLAELGARLYVGPHHLQRTFKRVVGITPRQYAEALRAARLKTRLRKGESVTNALYEAGYGSSSRLYERSSEWLGMTPATYWRGGQGMQISYAIASCPLGLLLVGTTEKGICAVYLGDSEEQLQLELRSEYPTAEMHRDDADSLLEVLLRYLDGEQPHVDLPLDVRATAFQRRVWEELMAIPRGETRTYGEVARNLGQPGAARAVARACATNPVSVVIPCHRVVREDGGLGGYRWGLERKRALLEGERDTSPGRAGGAKEGKPAPSPAGRAEPPRPEGLR